MAEEIDELVFDPSVMKKKKKKKKEFDLDAALREDSAEPTGKAGDDNAASFAGSADTQVQSCGDSVVPERDDGGFKDQETLDVDLELDLTKLKKKKKTKKVFLDGESPSGQAGVNAVGAGGVIGTGEGFGGSTPAGEDKKEKEEAADMDLEFDLTKKKKKKIKGKQLLDIDEDALKTEGGSVGGVVGEGKENDVFIIDESKGIDFSSASDRDYTYEELLNRAFAIMREKNPEMVAGEKKKFIMKPPQVVRIGAKKTSFANFTEICKMLHRQQKHVLQFLFAELGTQGSVDGNNMLIIKGRFSQKQIENVLRRYIKEYVTCHTCRSPETILEKDTRLFFLRCESCGSRCSVASIKSGYQAVTGKRAAQRAKNA